MVYTTIVDREDIYEIISHGLKEGIISGEEAFRMILTTAPSYYTRLLCPKRVGNIQYSSEKEDLIRELGIPYEKGENEIRIYSDQLSQESYEFLSRHKDPESLIERKIMEGFPRCCARAYITTELERKPHKFFEEISLKIRGKCRNLRDFADLVEEGEIYPTEFLYRDDLVPHGIDCKPAIQASVERETILEIADTKIGNIGWLGLKEEIEKSRILNDYIKVLESIGYLSNLRSLRNASKMDVKSLNNSREMRN